MSNLTDRFAGLSPQEKRGLLAELLRKKSAASSAEFPLSYGQKALLYLSRLHPDASNYNAMFVFQVEAKINFETLRVAFQQIIDRHAVLRTTYALDGANPVQKVHSGWQADFEVADARGWSETQLDSRMIEEASRPFSLQNGPIMRLRVYSRSAESHTILLSVHHIAFDFWSHDVFARELKEFYACVQEGRPSSLAPLRSQFAEFVRWQAEQLTGPQGEELLGHWQKELAGDLPVLDLPSDRLRPTVQTYNGDSLRFILEPALVNRLRDLAKEENVTLYVLLLAAYQVLLHRYTGQQDILIGTPMACRDAVEFEHLIGYFSTVMPLRANLADDPPFLRLVSQVRDKVIGALEHQACPFTLLVERIAPRRDASRSPLFDVAFSWEKAGFRDTQGATNQSSTKDVETPLPLEFLYARQIGAPYDLSLLVFESQAELSGTFLYNTDLFDKERIGGMAAHFETLLRGIAENPTACVSQIPLLSVEERARLLTTWNATESPYPRDKSLQELFEEQAAAKPEAVAVVFGAEQFTYGELNRRANQLAWYLKKRGAGPDVLVGVCLERSATMIVALLAIGKAGAAYVPLDPSYPEERLKFMLVDTQAPVVIAEKRTRGKWLEEWGEVVWIDGEAERIGEESEENPECSTNGESLAYVMYTSGSTGTPKGIEIRQRAIARLVLNTDYVQLGPEDRIAQASNTSFDAATFEIWGALLNGGRVVGVSKDVALSAGDYADVIQREGITTLFLTTALFNKLAAEMPGMFAGVKQVLFGGEAVQPRWVARVLQEGKPNRLLHVYGPTETTTFATWHEVKGAAEGATTVPIGRPIRNTRAYVLDHRGEPVPVGMTGELFIGGDGVARAYFNRPELTQERFVADRLSSEPNSLLYRTGDLVRYRADGNLEFVGRADQQVKIRGFRIELGEVESVLQKHPAVHEAFVLVREEASAEKRLVAYIVPRETGVESSELRQWAKLQLPDYMVPGAFVFLDRIPLNVNGKVDKQALPAPAQSRPELEVAFAAPETDLEQAIAKIWKEALGVKEVGRNDNFFDLGGHSLLVVQMHPRLEEAARRKVAIVDVFRHPTIGSLARHLSQAEPKERAFDEVQERARQQRLALAQRAGATRSWRPVNG